MTKKAHGFDTSEEGILQLIRAGESQRVEFKRRPIPQEEVARVLAAFANTDGGILLLGVTDDGQIAGLSAEEKAVVATTLGRVSESLIPGGAVGLAAIEDKVIAYAAVPPIAPPYFPVSTSRGEVLKRVGAETRPFTREELLPSGGSPVSKRAAPSDRKARVFVAMSFREEEEPALVDYFAAIRRASDRTNVALELRRVDLIEGDYEISQKIVDEIAACDIMIADFTLSPHNVYFELGVARGRGKRVIQTARKSTALQFDVRNWRTLFYRNATELEEKLLQELSVALRDLGGSARS
jgi:hypothetical protein